MIATNLAIGVVLLSLLGVRGRDQLWLIYTVTFAYGAGLQTVSEGMRLIAPLAGAGLFVLIGRRTLAALAAAVDYRLLLGVMAAVTAAAAAYLALGADPRPEGRH